MIVMIDDVILDKKGVVKAWVYEDGGWTFREITEAEFNSISSLLQFDLSELTKS